MAAIRPNPRLSDDLISEILIRVPVKSLLCFQLVCKTWLSLIKHPAFVKSQLRHAITTQTDTLIISHFKRYEGKKYLLLDLESRQIVADLKRPYSLDDLTHIPFPRLVDSANGIVCVGVAAINADCAVQKDSIYLWNPAIRQSKLIPSCNIGYDIDEDVLGFGYDGVDHDYKVLRVVGIESRPYFHAQVYSDNRKTWRNLPDPIDIPHNPVFNVHVNGFLCCIGEKNGIMAFDLNKEVLNCGIKFPIIDDVHDRAHGDGADDAHDLDDFQILEFNNSLAVILLMNDGSNVGKTDRRICIWTLNDHTCLRGGGVEASWTPMFCVNFATPGQLLAGFFSNGNFLLIITDDDQMWISCHDDKKEAKIVPLSIDMSDHLYSHHIYKYTESLVSLVGFRHVKWNAGEDDD